MFGTQGREGRESREGRECEFTGSFPVLPVLPVLPVFYVGGPTRAPLTLKLKLPPSRRRYSGLTASLVLHGVVLGLLLTQGDRLWSPTLVPGDAALTGGGSSGGGGGNRVAYITLPSIPEPVEPALPRAAPIPPPKLVARPATVPEQPEAVLPQPADSSRTGTAPAVTAAGDTGAGVGASQGLGNGPGQGQANGPGRGTGAGPGGEGGKVRPPEPRDMAFPFDNPPKELRGISLNVTFWVRIDGRVERYTVEPEIKDRDYAKKFDEVMRAFRFTPARAPDGTRVPGTTRISFTLPGKSSS